jgi:uncharacterized protein (DUF2249 family)
MNNSPYKMQLDLRVPTHLMRHKLTLAPLDHDPGVADPDPIGNSK